MTNENKDSLNALIEHSIKSNWNLMALSDMGGVNLQYKDVALLIAKMHILFEAAGVERGDKVAICGKNSSNWTVVFLSCLTAGVVAVPIHIAQATASQSRRTAPGFVGLRKNIIHRLCSEIGLGQHRRRHSGQIRSRRR